MYRHNLQLQAISTSGWVKLLVCVAALSRGSHTGELRRASRAGWHLLLCTESELIWSAGSNSPFMDVKSLHRPCTAKTNPCVHIFTKPGYMTYCQKCGVSMVMKLDKLMIWLKLCSHVLDALRLLACHCRQKLKISPHITSHLPFFFMCLIQPKFKNQSGSYKKACSVSLVSVCRATRPEHWSYSPTAEQSRAEQSSVHYFLKTDSFWVCLMSKLHHIQHCTSLGSQQHTCQRWSWSGEPFSGYSTNNETQRHVSLWRQ